jgi:hypothetical protein
MWSKYLFYVAPLTQYFVVFLVETGVALSHEAGKYDKDEEADDLIQGKNTPLYSTLNLFLIFTHS